MQSNIDMNESFLCLMAMRDNEENSNSYFGMDQNKWYFIQILTS